MKRIIAVWIYFILAFGAISIILEPDITGHDIIEETPMYTTHAPIRINTNAASTPPQIDGGTTYWNGDWYVDNGTSLEYVNQTIVLSGNLQINQTGSLTFRNVTLVMNCSFRTEFNITSYGTFQVFDYDENMESKYDRSKITSPGFNYEYRFFVKQGSTFEITSADIRFTGWASPTKNGGISIETDNAKVIDALIMDSNPYYNPGKGIVTSSISNLIVQHCSFRNGAELNSNGLQGSSIEDNTFDYNSQLELDGTSLSSNVIIQNNVFSNNSIYMPVLIQNANNIDIRNNTFPSGLGKAIGFYSDVSSSSISNNIITDFVEEGINIAGSDDIVISNNTIQNCSIGTYVWTGASEISIHNNSFSNSHTGIKVGGASTNNITIRNNNIFNNTVGLNIYSNPRDNRIFNNSFVENNYQANNSGTNNQWDNDYPTGGNYWSDYTGTDYYSGSNQDIPGPDGIGDTPYTNIGGGTGTLDNYPLMWPVGFVDNSTPVTNLTINPPVYYNSSSNTYFMHSDTEMNLTASDNIGGAGLNATWFRVGKHSGMSIEWKPWTEYSGNFSVGQFFNVTDDDYRFYVEYFSQDLVGLNETASQITIEIDESAPSTMISPVFFLGNRVMSSQNFSFTPMFTVGSGDSGHNATYYRIWNGTWTTWVKYSVSFNLTGTDGTRYIEYYSIDNVGNQEAIQNSTFFLDNRAPQVAQTDPTDGWTEVPVNTTVIIQFDEDMFFLLDNTSVNMTPFVNYTITPIDNRTVEISFHTNLSYNTEYRFVISDMFRDLAGNHYTTGYEFAFTTQTDSDGDNIPDVDDTDNDNDGVPDDEDAFPSDAFEWADFDNDGIGDNADPDDDNDGVNDDLDAFPNDSTESADADGDGIGDNADPDDDNDGILDVDEGNPPPVIVEEYDINYPALILFLGIILACIYLMMFSKPD